MWAQGLGTTLPITASLLCSRTWSLLLAGPLATSNCLTWNKMDFSMKNIYTQPKIVWFSLIWLMACNNRLACLTFYFAVVRGEEKVSASVRNIHDIGGKKAKKDLLSISGLEIPEGSGRGLCSSKARLHHTPNPPCLLPASLLHSPCAGSLPAARKVCLLWHMFTCTFEKCSPYAEIW